MHVRFGIVRVGDVQSLAAWRSGDDVVDGMKNSARLVLTTLFAM